MTLLGNGRERGRLIVGLRGQRGRVLHLPAERDDRLVFRQERQIHQDCEDGWTTAAAAWDEEDETRDRCLSLGTDALGYDDMAEDEETDR